MERLLTGQLQGLPLGAHRHGDMIVGLLPAGALLGLGHGGVADQAALQRAVEIRGQPTGVPLVPIGEPEPGAPYALSKADRAREERCVAPYRDDPAFGKRAASGE